MSNYFPSIFDNFFSLTSINKISQPQQNDCHFIYAVLTKFAKAIFNIDKENQWVQEKVQKDPEVVTFVIIKFLQ